MDNDDVAEPQEKRAGGARRKPSKKRAETDRSEVVTTGLPTAGRNTNGKVSLDRIVAWICSASDHKIAYSTARVACVGRGMSIEGGLTIAEAVPVVADMLLKQLYTSTLDIKRDKARAAAAAADTAEIQLEQLKGHLVSRDEMRRVVENAVVTFREKVRGLEDLSLEQRKAVCDLLVNLKLDDEAER